MAFFALSRIQPLALLSATDLAAGYDRLLEENRHLRRAVTSHAVIDQAIGAVVALGQIAPEEAWRALRDVSQRTNVKLRTVAEHVLGYVQGGALPEPERIELAKAIVRYRRCGGRPAPLGDGVPAPATRGGATAGDGAESGTGGDAGERGGTGSTAPRRATAPGGPRPGPARPASDGERGPAEPKR
ncbi:ANTAR domain-containing protein [Streptomyces lavenduligriseus]|uniref:ANTAR domain-containing protein n=1 Tax=Streptomyces lavenduligriseus TaxID=67315 RepID=A0ABT0P4I7_9ACTN|nr:ANTAR domain-containing protein [Streptomyces lavenduligriseus]MCL3997828.1 ANTAR domain-containing protein [Streptomyces lavenduligriseus]